MQLGYIRDGQVLLPIYNRTKSLLLSYLEPFTDTNNIFD